MISLANADQAKELLGFFNRVWGSKAQVKDAKALLQAETSLRYIIFLKTLWVICKKTRS